MHGKCNDQRDDWSKALSPVRTVEWIYVDGLRKMYGWNSTAGGAREG